MKKGHEEKGTETIAASSKNTAVIAFVTFNIFISGFFISSVLNREDSGHDSDFKETSLPRAAIIDQSSIIYPNKTFARTATNLLERAGYSVDYYPYENVTVKFYKNLPARGYKLILLRIHASLLDTGYVTFFTSEHYDKSKYVNLQLNEQLDIAWFSPEDIQSGDTYFGVNHNFVIKSMNGRFDNTTIIMMGCDGLNNSIMAEAFIEKGAKAYVGWKVPVGIGETDQATTHMLRHFLIERTTLEESIRQTFKEIEIVPEFNNQLTYYPPEAGEQRIEDKR